MKLEYVILERNICNVQKNNIDKTTDDVCLKIVIR